MTLIRILIFLVFFVFLNGNAKHKIDQDSSCANKFVLKFTPQHILINGVRLEFEYLMGKHNHALMFAPIVYVGYGRSNSADNRRDEISGYGVEFFYKNYFFSRVFDEIQNLRIFVSPGLHYNKVKSKIYELGYYSVANEFGQNIIEHGYQTFEQKFDKFGISVSFGLSYVVLNRILVEPYLGLLHSFSKVEYSEFKTQENRYTEMPWQYGFDGFSARLGLHVGIIIFK